MRLDIYSAANPNRIFNFIRFNIHMIWREYEALPSGQNLKVIYPFGGLPTVMQWGVTSELMTSESELVIPNGVFKTIQDFYQWVLTFE